MSRSDLTAEIASGNNESIGSRLTSEILLKAPKRQSISLLANGAKHQVAITIEKYSQALEALRSPPRTSGSVGISRFSGVLFIRARVALAETKQSS